MKKLKVNGFYLGSFSKEKFQLVEIRVKTVLIKNIRTGTASEVSIGNFEDNYEEIIS